VSVTSKTKWKRALKLSAASATTEDRVRCAMLAQHDMKLRRGARKRKPPSGHQCDM
jgi:hypothetical protein